MKPLSLLTFFAAAKKVSAAPHRGNANRPLTQQGKAKAKAKPPLSPCNQHKRAPRPAKPLKPPPGTAVNK
ncbi:MAG: hypothetical protein DI523_38735 [Paraburkholderia fungorum]|nr:MAG: hypothetical protein DI523_38735 [Paraburkholderia fungorum]